MFTGMISLLCITELDHCEFRQYCQSGQIHYPEYRWWELMIWNINNKIQISLILNYNKHISCIKFRHQWVKWHPRSYGYHIESDTNWLAFRRRQVQRTFFNENVNLLIGQISLRFVPGCPINNKSALVSAMGLRRLGDKPIYQWWLTSLTHICVTLSQWVN